MGAISSYVHIDLDSDLCVALCAARGPFCPYAMHSLVATVLAADARRKRRHRTTSVAGTISMREMTRKTKRPLRCLTDRNRRHLQPSPPLRDPALCV